MTFGGLRRASLDASILLASLVLSVDAAADNPSALAQSAVYALVAIGAAWIVDRRPARALPGWIAQVLALMAYIAGAAEYYQADNILLALGHTLIYLAMVKRVCPRSLRDDWFLMLQGLAMVVIGAFMSQGDLVGGLLVAWALASLWTMALLHLTRESGRVDPGQQPPPDPADPYPGLVDRPFAVSSLKIALTTLALGGVIFLAMPRWGSTGGGHRGGDVTRHLSGFSETVKLGQIGEILENDSIVMTVELYDRARGGPRIRPEDDLLWRGVPLASYADGGWSREAVDPEANTIDRAPPPSAVLRQRIKIEPTGTAILFGLRPMFRAAYGSRNENPLGYSPTDATLYRPDDFRNEQFEYEVLSAANPRTPQPDEWLAGPVDLEIYHRPEPLILRRGLLDLPDGLKAQLAALAEPIVRAIPAHEVEARARALEGWLRDSRQFRYSVSMARGEAGVDPVLDFLQTRKSGHCEYFASALALLLRSVDIPSRVVNGFKGGDWNDLASVIYVRQKHAHSWVEALRPVKDARHPEWFTLDPTPAAEREESVALVGGDLGKRVRPLSDYLRYIWVFYIVGFNADRQRRLLYDPIRALIDQASQGFRVMGAWLEQAATLLLRARDLRSFFTWQGFVIGTVAVALVAGPIAVGWWLVRRLTRRGRARSAEVDELAVGVAFYRRLSTLLAAVGLERPPAETPREFARRAAAFLDARGPSALDLAAVPAEVVDAYYRVRYGLESFDPEALHALESRLDALEAGLLPSGEADAG